MYSLCAWHVNCFAGRSDDLTFTGQFLTRCSNTFRLINPRRACARVTVVVLSVCVSVPTLAASASVGTSKQRYSRVSLRLFLDYMCGVSKKPSVQKLWREKANKRAAT